MVAVSGSSHGPEIIVEFAVGKDRPGHSSNLSCRPARAVSPAASLYFYPVLGERNWLRGRRLQAAEGVGRLFGFGAGASLCVVPPEASRLGRAGWVDRRRGDASRVRLPSARPG